MPRDSSPTIQEFNPILAEPLRVEKGIAIVSDAIGTGVDWDEDAVHRFAA